jgi:L-alanine-DL-glutamate epimerase-like enolase superfamily enzyme
MTDAVQGVELFALNFPYQSKVQFRSSQCTGGLYVFLRLTTRDGAQGIAEVTGIPNVPASDPHVLAQQFDGVFRELLEGADPLDRERVDGALANVSGAGIAKALIDTALWDLKGKLLGQPVWRLLGGAAPKPVPVTAILFGDTAGAMLADAERTVARGIRALKVKLWRHSIDDVTLVRDIRAAVGDDVLIYADANHSYTEDEARTLLPQLAPYDVALIEDPCNVSAERLAELSRALPIPILAEIPIDSLATAQHYVEVRAAGALSVHVRRTGITETLEIIARCARAGLPAIVGTDLESSLGALARVHLRVAVRSLEPWPSEVQFFERLAGDVLAEPLAVVDGAIAVPDRPGFGASIDETKLRRYRVRG